MPTDRIELKGLRAFGHHGALPHERVIGQEFVVDAVLWLDTRPAAAADDLSLTVDYGALSNRLAQIIGGDPVALIETLAERLAAECLRDDRIGEVEIVVHKPHAPVSVVLDDVCVAIRRGRE
jgi:dihydroneopterin aldolase